ncbi:hypothetical protein [Streptomyces sp. NPDC048473]|uniref:hypothetical protein n=1 Tax=unclassified Streptomyces TaxID=2593676 RepID=UPI00371A8F8F
MSVEEARENLDRLRIAREMVSEVMAEVSANAIAAVDAEPEAVGPDETKESSAYAGAERQKVGVLAVAPLATRDGPDQRGFIPTA